MRRHCAYVAFLDKREREDWVLQVRMGNIQIVEENRNLHEIHSW